MPFRAHGTDGHIRDRLRAAFALGLEQSQMTSFAVRMTFMDHKCVGLACVGGIVASFSAAAVLAPELCARRGRMGRIEEWVAAFGAEEMQLVVVSFAQVGVVQRDKARVNDGCFAMETFVGEFLVRQFRPKSLAVGPLTS